MFFVFFGREPELSLAELESRITPAVLKPAGKLGAFIDQDEIIVPFSQLGGVLKLMRVTASFSNSSWREVYQRVLKETDFCQLFDCLKDYKFSLGISVYGMDVPVREITRLGLDLKKKFRRASTTHKLRIVPNKQAALSSAQVLHNHLYDSSRGAELVILMVKGKIHIGLTTHIQDIDAYSQRDYGRPCRDARVGMLPPKLAQIILNLAMRNMGREPNDQSAYILDPFCGTGVVLQEALLMGCYAMGGDINKKMVECTRTNIEWLHTTMNYTGTLLGVETADAIGYTWPRPFDAVASEIHLGPPLEKLPPLGEIERIANEANQLLKSFLQNLASQITSDSLFGPDICLAVPAWQMQHRQFRTLPILDKLTDIGYTWSQFSHVNTQELFYARPHQVVGRQLVVIERI